ncbi:hypothetical protein cyc_02413 [Cyclospora cayetanensis]|uniref:Uncharacterized protein n=1 Tax=Cyclospora cayetanensis TaxID=88456 RepID=A0A1D3D969_9EIME|nr:hypothetical protein cyc_02413 [Cyclospora cayetanensis]
MASFCKPSHALACAPIYPMAFKPIWFRRCTIGLPPLVLRHGKALSSPACAFCAPSSPKFLSANLSPTLGAKLSSACRMYTTKGFGSSIDPRQGPPLMPVFRMQGPNETAATGVEGSTFFGAAVEGPLPHVVSDRKRKILNGTEYIRRKTGYRGRIRRGRQAPC